MADNSNTNLFANSSSLDKMVRIVKSQAKESSLNASDQIPDGGYVVVVSYGDTKYVKITDGKNTFSDLPDIGSGGEGVWGSITGDIEDQTDLVSYIAENGGSVELGQGLHFDNYGKINAGTINQGGEIIGGISENFSLFGIHDIDEQTSIFNTLELSSTPSYHNALKTIVNFSGLSGTNEIKTTFTGVELTAGSSSDFTKIQLSSQDIIISNTSGRGITYGSDYSANFTERSLVDKGYVDSVVGETTTWSNIEGKPAFVAEGVDAGAARTALGLGTAATTSANAYATSAQGSKADTALQPGYLESISGYDAGESQTLKNNSGTLEWVTD